MRSLIALQDRLLATLGNGDSVLQFARALFLPLRLHFISAIQASKRLATASLGSFNLRSEPMRRFFPHPMEAASHATSQLEVFIGPS